MRFVGILHAKALERAEVDRDSLALRRVFPGSPKTIAILRAKFSLDVAFKILLNAIVVDQGVVHVDKEDHWCLSSHCLDHLKWFLTALIRGIGEGG